MERLPPFSDTPSASSYETPAWPLLAGLTLAVAAAHLWVLQAAPLQAGNPPTADKTARAFAFITRAVEAPKAPPAPVAISPAPQVAKAPPPKRIAPIKRTPAATPPPATDKPAEAVVFESGAAIVLGTKVASNEPASTPETFSVAPAGPASAASATKIVESSAAAALPASASASASTTTTTATANAAPATTRVTGVLLPPSLKLQYKVLGNSKGMNYNANGELDWRNNGSQYEVTMKVSAFILGSRSMSSVGQISATGLAPSRFSDKFKTEVATHFEADKGQITFSTNAPSAPLVEGAQDRVSIFMQLAGMLAAKPAEFELGSSITIYTAGPRGADVWTFFVESRESLNLPTGTLATLKLTRKPLQDYDQKLEVWYAPELGYLPVRNRISLQNGDFIDQQLTGIVKP